MGQVASFTLLSHLIRMELQKQKEPLIIQTHDYPDHDAVSSAFGLGRLLSLQGVPFRILHRGDVRSLSLRSMIESFRIPLEQVDEESIPRGGGEGRTRCQQTERWEKSMAPCVIVDGSPRNVNARPLTANLLGVIDHHPNPGNLSCPFQDIRVSYGSCSTIIADYWEEAGLTPDRDTATALLMGLQIDTDFLSRRVSPADLDAHYRLFFRADWHFGTRLARASLSLSNLPTISAAINRARIKGGLFFTVIAEDCSQELISILADFFLRLREIYLTVITETGGGLYHVSVRSRNPEISAAAVVKRALAGIGTGGGHDHMAGGTVNPSVFPGEEQLFNRFIQALEAIEENQ